MVDRLVSHWWLFLIRGLLALAFGIALLAFPLAGLFVIAILFGAYAFVDGVLALVAATRMRHTGGSWGWLLLEGVVGIVAGICAALWPGCQLQPAHARQPQHQTCGTSVVLAPLPPWTSS